MRCDAHKFAKMYETVYIDLYRFALCLMKNSHDAEDAVSEAVLKAYENVGKLRSEDAFKNWIFTITSNTCRARLKEAAKKKSEPIDETVHNIPAKAEDYDVPMDIRKAFQALSEEEREIIALSVFGGYNSKEVGKILGLNDNTVRSKKTRALEKMGTILK